MSRVSSRLAIGLLTALLPADLGCPGEGSSRRYFTVALYDPAEGPANATPHTLIYVVWGPEPPETAGACTFFVYDFSGEASRYTLNDAPAYVLSHSENQGSDTYVQFFADAAQMPTASCQALDSQVDAGERFIMFGSLVAPFNPDAPLPGDVSVVSEAYVATGTWSRDAGPTEGAFYLYDFEINRNQIPAPLAAVGPER